MATKRFVIEATWSGYVNGQRRVCHRTVETYWRAGWEAIRFHQFGDNTYMSVDVRDAKPRERVHEIHGYDKLLRELAYQNYVAQKSVADAKRNTSESET